MTDLNVIFHAVASHAHADVLRLVTRSVRRLRTSA